MEAPTRNIVLGSSQYKTQDKLNASCGYFNRTGINKFAAEYDLPKKKTIRRIEDFERSPVL